MAPKMPMKTAMTAIPPAAMGVPRPVQWKPVGNAPTVWFARRFVAIIKSKLESNATMAPQIPVTALGHNPNSLVMCVVTAKPKPVQPDIAVTVYISLPTKSATMVGITAIPHQMPVELPATIRPVVMALWTTAKLVMMAIPSPGTGVPVMRS